MQVYMLSNVADDGNASPGADWSKTWVDPSVALSEEHIRPQHFHPVLQASCCLAETWNNHNDPDTCTIISIQIYAYKQ